MEKFNFDGDVLIDVKKALKEYRLSEYLRYLSQEDILKIYLFYSQKE